MLSDLPNELQDGLSETTEWVIFDTQEQLATAIGTLLACHHHSFIVHCKGGWTLVVSNVALRCLESRLAEMTLVDASVD